MSLLLGSICTGNLIKPYLTLPYLMQVNNTFPYSARGYLNLAQPGVTLPEQPNPDIY